MMGWHRKMRKKLANGQLFDEETRQVKSSIWSSFLLKNKNDMMEQFSSCLGALKLIKNGWETEAIPEKVGSYSQNKGFFSKIFSKFS